MRMAHQVVASVRDYTNVCARARGRRAGTIGADVRDIEGVNNRGAGNSRPQRLSCQHQIIRAQHYKFGQKKTAALKMPPL